MSYITIENKYLYYDFMCIINFSFDGCRFLDFKIVIYECSKILKCSLYIKNVIT